MKFNVNFHYLFLCVKHLEIESDESVINFVIFPCDLFCYISEIPFELCREKTCLGCFWPGTA